MAKSSRGRFTGKAKIVKGRIVAGSIKSKGPSYVSTKPRPLQKLLLRPTKAMAREMKRIIRSEPLLVGGIIECKSAGHCAMGALAFSLDITLSEMKRINAYGGQPDQWPKRVVQLLYDHFRIDKKDMERIISANDRVHQKSTVFTDDREYEVLPTRREMRDRRKEVLKEIDSIADDARLRLPPRQQQDDLGYRVWLSVKNALGEETTLKS